MTYYEDLTFCSYFGYNSKMINLKAIGWLSKGFPYSTGRVPIRLVKKLKRLFKNPWEPGFGYLGYHECEFCKVRKYQSALNLFIPGEGVIYVSPEGILHYIEVHSYKPPKEFLTAVDKCPQTNSDEYFNRLIAIGGAEFKKRIEKEIGFYQSIQK